MPFKRGLCDAFINRLHAEAKKPGWWRDILDDKTLLIGVRENYLNIYWRGQALFTVREDAEGLRVTTHEKYLLDPDLADQVELEDGRFRVEGLQANGFLSQFKVGETLPKMKRAAQRFAGKEKKGCHVIAEKNTMVVDFEVALPIDANISNKLNKIDLACFERRDQAVRLTFWEAKDFSNPELRAKIGDAPVVQQVRRYTDWITAHRAELEKSYRCIAKNLMAFKEMGWKRTLHELVEAVAADQPLYLDDVPPVSLLIFGFDQDQKIGNVWKERRQNLEVQIKRVVALGKAKNIRLPSHTMDNPVENPIPET